MTKTVNKFFAVLLAIAMIFSLSVIGFAEDGTFGLKSGNAVAATGKFKDRYVGNLNITAKANVEFSATDKLSVIISGTDGQSREFKASDAKVKINGKTVTITLPYNGTMAHEADYTVVVLAGSFASADGKTNSDYSFTVNGNLILENLNVDRPSTTMQRFIKWLSSWKYADLIKPIIDLLKWFDSL